MNAKEKMNAKIKTQDTERLIDISNILIMKFDDESGIVKESVDNELSERLSEDQLAKLWNHQEELLDAA